MGGLYYRREGYRSCLLQYGYLDCRKHVIAYNSLLAITCSKLITKTPERRQ